MHLYLNFNSLGVIGSPTVISIASGTLDVPYIQLI